MRVRSERERKNWEEEGPRPGVGEDRVSEGEGGVFWFESERVGGRADSDGRAERRERGWSTE